MAERDDDGRRAGRMQSMDEAIGSLDMRQGEEQAYQCEHHGEYRGQPFTLTGRSWIEPACPECERERKAKEAAEEKRARAEAEARRVVIAGIPERFRKARFDQFEAEVAAQRQARHFIRRYTETFADRRRQGSSLILAGNTGTGKTMLVCAAAVALIQDGWRVRYSDVMGLMQAIKATYQRGAAETEEQAIQRFTAPDLLILDEVGVQYGTDSERAMLHHILDRRYLDVRPTIVCGNVDLEGMRTYLGERAVSRLRENEGAVIKFGWGDYRTR